MTPAARIAAAIDILEAAEDGRSGLDRVLTSYFRQRRYAGSKDRAAISDTVYGVTRRRFRLDWWIDRQGAGASARSRVIAHLALGAGALANELAALFDGSAHGPEPLSGAEVALHEALLGQALDHESMSRAVRAECPDWIARRLQSVLGDRFERCLAGLGQEAGFDLRLNPVVTTDRDAVRHALAKQGLETEPTPYSPLGLRAARRQPVEGLRSYKTGVVEVQDEGAQLASLLVDARPGMQVADFCAGAGGKTLVLGACMENKGRVLAMDVGEDRLERAARRVSRARLHNVERRVLAGENDRRLKRLAKRFDRVLVDAPCTGIGTWRRNPESRRRYGEADLETMVVRQDSILAAAARLTKPGGRLIYVTCSLLAEENEKRVAALLVRRDDFRLVPITGIWRETVAALGGAACPTATDVLTLTPDTHGTDGFFVAVLERRAE